MNWRKHLTSDKPVIIYAPYLGDGRLTEDTREWRVDDAKLEEGWYHFQIEGRKATRTDLPWREPDNELGFRRSGYLVGDRFISENEVRILEPADVVGQTERVHLIPEDLEPFARVEVGRSGIGTPFVYFGRLFPTGAEDAAQLSLEEGEEVMPLRSIRGLTPALEAVVLMGRWRKAEIERLAREAEELARLEAEVAALEAAQQAEVARKEAQRKRDMATATMTPELRREIALTNFGHAAQAALLSVGGEYLSHREVAGNYVVRFKLPDLRRRFECVVTNQLRVVDSGICLVDHHTNERGDTRFTLESLPGVMREAARTGRLVVFRHF